MSRKIPVKFVTAAKPTSAAVTELFPTMVYTLIAENRPAGPERDF